MNKYMLIKQDYFNDLELGKIYNIKDNVIYNDAGTVKMFRVTSWQLENMFEEVPDSEI